MKKTIKLVIFFMLVQVLFAISAAAYLDPSAMTYIIQAIAGIVIAGGAAVTIYWKKIKMAIKKRKTKSTTVTKSVNNIKEDSNDTKTPDSLIE